MVNSERTPGAELDVQRVKNCLTDIRGRMYRQACLQTFTSTFFWGLVLFVLLSILNRVIRLPMTMLTVSGLLIFVAVIVGIGRSVKHRKDLHCIARGVDEKMGLRERLSTALGLIQSNAENEFAQLQIRDAAEIATTLNAVEVSPYRVPKLLKLFPIPLLLIGFSFAISPFYEVPRALTKLQQQTLGNVIQNLEDEHVENSDLKHRITDTVKALKAASDLNTVRKHLSDLKKEVRKQQAAQTAITEATEASQSFRGMDATQLTTELKNLTEQPQIPPELQAELMGIFERLAADLPPGGLSDALNQIQEAGVTPETLGDIIAALEQMEKSSDLAQLVARLTANQKELALATIDTEAVKGGVASSEGGPGQDAGTKEVEGTREGRSNAEPRLESQTAMENETGQPDSTAPLTGEETSGLQIDGEGLTLTAGASGNAEGFSRVFTGAVTDEAPAYLPFADVVLNASRAYAEAVENNRIPIRYQTQIKSYLEAISRK